jgi:hypothetical protein
MKLYSVIVEYKGVDMQNTMNKYSAQGWVLHSYSVIDGGHSGYFWHAIMEKEPK